jgi:hypothetical protein
MLYKDNAAGSLAGDAGAVVIAFPGRARAEPLVFGPFRQDGTLDGQVIRVGGTDDIVPVHLRDGAVIHTGLFAESDLARHIAQHFHGPTLRMHGTGTWFRAVDGTWELRSFKISSFDVLDETPLVEVVGALRNVKGNGWNEVPDPIRALLGERHVEGDAH